MSDKQPRSAFDMYSLSVTEKKAKKKKVTKSVTVKEAPKKLKLANGDAKPIKATKVVLAKVNGITKTKKKKVGDASAPIVATTTTSHSCTTASVIETTNNGPILRPESVSASGNKPHKEFNGKSNATKSSAMSASNGHETEDFEVVSASSIDQGKGLLAKLIAPMSIKDFFKDFWEKRPLLVKRRKPGYFSSLGLSSESLDLMLRKNHLRYTKNIDITSYKDGKRETHNPPGRAMPAEVWDFFNDGCSVRWLNPQTYAHMLYMFCAALQEYLECFVGANVYLTPPNSQGFAPHYDDIEAFILQLEGRKHWKLYKSPLAKDVLPRSSSGNYSADEIGLPFMEVILDPGDLLYFPRGTIHQAVATDAHSLHVTLSAYQHNTWADLLEQLLPAALSQAASSNPALRGGLPVGHLSYMGSVHQEHDPASPQRTSFLRTVQEMVACVMASASVDGAVDAMAKRFMQDALPPHLTAAEARCTMQEDGDRLAADGKLANSWSMDKDTHVKLTRAHCARLIYEEGNPRLYYTLDNTRVYHEEDPGFFELTPEMVPCVQLLFREYPSFIPLDMMPLSSLEHKVAFASQLWMKGLLMTHQPIGADGDEKESVD